MAWGHFAKSFMDGYIEDKRIEEAEEKDRLRIDGQRFLDEEKSYKQHQSKDEKLVEQAKALVASETLLPAGSEFNIYEALKTGRTVDSILTDVRRAGAEAWEAIPKPPENTGGIIPEDQQIEEVLGENITVFNPASKAGADISPLEPKRELSSRERKVADLLGVDEDYFSQIRSGYVAGGNLKKQFNFVPGMSNVTVDTLDQRSAKLLYESKAYKDAKTPKEKMQVILNAKAGSSGPKFKFGTGGPAMAMSVWAETEEGKAALDSNDAMGIAKQWATFNEIINPGNKEKSTFDIKDLPSSFFSIWQNSPEGKKAIAEGDSDAINIALAAAHEQANTARDAINQGYGFDPSAVTKLDQIPGLEEKYKNYPEILSQLQNIKDSLKAQATNSGTAKPKTIFNVIDGKLNLVGTGIWQGGQLKMANPDNPEEWVTVNPQDAANYIIADPDATLNAEKWSANEITKKKNTLHASVDSASAALTYMAELEKTPTARTTVARFTSGAQEFLTEIETLKEISTFVNADGEEMIDELQLIREIQGNSALNKYSADVRSIMAQETALVFSIARSEGNSGHALSNKDYDNYFKSIFNSNDPEVIRANLERKVGQAFKAAVNGASSLKNSPGMKLVTSGTGTQWWADPRATALDGKPQAVINFIDASTNRIDTLQESSSYGTTTDQLIQKFNAGEEIRVTQELADKYPEDLGDKVGKLVSNSAIGGSDAQ